MRRLTAMCAGFLLLALSSPCVRAEAGDGGGSALQSEKALSARVTVDQPLATLKEVLDGIRAQTGVSLRAETGKRRAAHRRANPFRARNRLVDEA